MEEKRYCKSCRTQQPSCGFVPMRTRWGKITGYKCAKCDELGKAPVAVREEVSRKRRELLGE